MIRTGSLEILYPVQGSEARNHTLSSATIDNLVPRVLGELERSEFSGTKVIHRCGEEGGAAT